MNIKDLDFHNELGENSRILGGLGATDNVAQIMKQRFLSRTGQVAGILDTSYNATATGTNEADVSFVSNHSGDALSKVNIGFSTTTSGFATTPGT